jgi:hypothetical protein
MRRKQRAFASLTDAEIEQIANWLRLETYEHVRERIAKPRPEGFGLELNSTRPLETLWQKKNTVDKINNKLATGEKLTVTEFDAINSAEKTDVPEKIHDAILETTYELVIEGDNTPTQLLALQRLADFPVRAELRTTREQRQTQVHSWKAEAQEWKRESHALKKEMHECRLDQAAHRKQIADQRFALAKSALDLRQKQIAMRSDQNPRSEFRNSQSSFVPWTADDIIHNQAKVEAAIQADPFLSQIGLPPEPDPNPLCGSRREEALTDPASSLSEPLSARPAPQMVTSSHSSQGDETLEKNDKCKMLDAQSSMDPSATSTSNPAAISDLLISHALRRWRAYLPRSYNSPEPDPSWRDECPCGKPLPCEEHPDLHLCTRYLKPCDPDYAAALQQAAVPSYTPSAAELGCSEHLLKEMHDPFAFNPKTPVSATSPFLPGG